MQTQTGGKPQVGDRVKNGEREGVVLLATPDKDGDMVVDVAGTYTYMKAVGAVVLSPLWYLNIYPPRECSPNWRNTGTWETSREKADSKAEPDRLGVLSWDGTVLAVAT